MQRLFAGMLLSAEALLCATLGGRPVAKSGGVDIQTFQDVREPSPDARGDARLVRPLEASVGPFGPHLGPQSELVSRRDRDGERLGLQSLDLHALALGKWAQRRLGRQINHW
jgi:hypothetical protein